MADETYIDLIYRFEMSREDREGLLEAMEEDVLRYKLSDKEAIEYLLLMTHYFAIYEGMDPDEEDGLLDPKNFSINVQKAFSGWMSSIQSS